MRNTIVITGFVLSLITTSPCNTASADIVSLLEKLARAVSRRDVCKLSAIADPECGIWFWQDCGAGGPMPLFCFRYTSKVNPFFSNEFCAGNGGDSTQYFNQLQKCLQRVIVNHTLKITSGNLAGCDDEKGITTRLTGENIQFSRRDFYNITEIIENESSHNPIRYQFSVTDPEIGGVKIFLTQRGGKLYVAHVMVIYCDL